MRTLQTIILGGTTLFLTLLLPFSLSHGVAAGNPSSEGKAETMLMFVGEDLDVLSIASRREESAWNAPAVAQVITEKEMREKGMETVSQALALTPGFYMAKKEWGSSPFLRGIPDSVLFLYDTVPLGSDISKSSHPIDQELSLAAVKRIEIVRGPGSVLWGPDAYAGIVNIVPLTGRDVTGVEAGFFSQGLSDGGGAYSRIGMNRGAWDGFLAVSGRSGEEEAFDGVNLVRFWGEEASPVSYEERFGTLSSSRSHDMEASGNLTYGKWLTFSMRLSDTMTPYEVSNEAGSLTWPEERNMSTTQAKIEARKEIGGDDALRFTFFYAGMRPEHRIVDLTIPYDEDTLYGEAVYDHGVMDGKGIFTGGISFRKKRITDAPVWNSYFPDYFGEENLLFFPQYVQADYHSELFSLFGQYVHRVGDFEWLLGLRNDDHSNYQDKVSYTTGLVWSPDETRHIKMFYGNAYRTPFAKQLRTESLPALENIESFNIVFGYKPVKALNLSLCGFTSTIDNHVKEDPYAGLSDPNRQRIRGIEGQVSLLLSNRVTLGNNFTFLENNGPDETYWLVEGLSVDEEGNLVYENPKERRYPYDTGPLYHGNLWVLLKPLDAWTCFANARYSDATKWIHPRSETVQSLPGAWLFDVAMGYQPDRLPGFVMELKLNNLLDKTSALPGTNYLIERDGRCVVFTMRKKW